MGNGTVLGGLLKITVAGVLAWAWTQGHLGRLVAAAQAAIAGTPTPVGSTTSTSSSSSSTTGATA